jgi:alpha-ribazole phosphatase
MRIWLVRHAPVVVKGLCYGQHDVPCTMSPAAAAEEVAARLPIDLRELWCSPWARARAVAEALSRRLHIPLLVDGRLSELHMGAFEGRSFLELERVPAFSTWMRNWPTASPPGGETLAQLAARVAAWKRERDEPREGTLLAFTHAGPIRALRALARGISLEDALASPVEHLVPEELK